MFYLFLYGRVPGGRVWQNKQVLGKYDNIRKEKAKAVYDARLTTGFLQWGEFKILSKNIKNLHNNRKLNKNRSSLSHKKLVGKTHYDWH